MTPTYAPELHRIKELDALSSVTLFRELLFAEGAQRNLTNINISVLKINAADGGIDASADFTELAGEPRHSAHYQLKSGPSFKPWEPAALHNEFFQKPENLAERGNLGDAVVSCLERNGTYVLVCFGHDLTTPQKTTTINGIKQIFTKCGYDNAGVEVWGTGDVAKKLEAHPSLCLALNGRSFEGLIQTFDSWAKNIGMDSTLASGSAQTGAIQEICDHLLNQGVHHVQLVGEPGCGKTRIALEAIRSREELRCSVVYAPQAASLLANPLLNELRRTDRRYHVVLVLDDCEADGALQVISSLLGREGVKILSITQKSEIHGDANTKSVRLPPLADEDVASILKSHACSDDDANRWAPFCGGSPRVAHIIGGNLSTCPEDILKCPSHVNLWDRFISGNQSEEAADRTRTVLEHIALFSKFGHKAPVHEDGAFIARLVQKVDPAIGTATFNRIIHRLVQKRILIGSHTLHISPPALQAYLWRQWWTIHGATIDFANFVLEIPPPMQRWFAEQMSLANEDGAMQASLAAAICHPDGKLATKDFILSDFGALFYCYLAEGAPDMTMRALRHGFDTITHEDGEALKTVQTPLVRTFRKLGTHARHFEPAVKFLARLIQFDEPEKFSAARSGMLTLFQNFGGPTSAPPSERLKAIKPLFKLGRIQAEAARDACETLLNTRGHTIEQGIEHQGLNPTAIFWRQTISDEILQVWRETISCLEGTIEDGDEEWRSTVSRILCNSSCDLLRFSNFLPDALATLVRLVNKPESDIPHLAAALVENIQENPWNLPKEVITQLDDMLTKLGQGDWEQRFYCYVCCENWPSSRRSMSSPDKTKHHQSDRKNSALAKELVSAVRCGSPELYVALQAESYRVAEFGDKVAGLTNKHDDWAILLAAAAMGGDAKLSFIGGYLGALHRTDKTRWQPLALSLLEAKTMRWAQTVIRSGTSWPVLRRLLLLCKKGIIHPSLFRCVSNLRHGKSTPLLVTRLIHELLAQDSDGTLVAAELAHHALFVMGWPLADETIWQIICHPGIIGKRSRHLATHYWVELTEEYRRRQPADDMKLFEIIIKAAGANEISVSSSMLDSALKIAATQMRKSWHIIGSELDKGDSPVSLLEIWLGGNFSTNSSPPPITTFDPSTIIKWVDRDVSRRAPIIARVLPRDIDAPYGDLTVKFLERYCDDSELRAKVVDRFSFGGISNGPHSMACLTRKEQAEIWLSKTSTPRLIIFLDELTRELAFDINRSIVMEERLF